MISFTSLTSNPMLMKILWKKTKEKKDHQWCQCYKTNMHRRQRNWYRLFCALSEMSRPRRASVSNLNRTSCKEIDAGEVKRGEGLEMRRRESNSVVILDSQAGRLFTALPRAILKLFHSHTAAIIVTDIVWDMIALQFWGSLLRSEFLIRLTEIIVSVDTISISIRWSSQIGHQLGLINPGTFDLSWIDWFFKDLTKICQSVFSVISENVSHHTQIIL